MFRLASDKHNEINSAVVAKSDIPPLPVFPRKGLSVSYECRVLGRLLASDQCDFWFGCRCCSGVVFYEQWRVFLGLVNKVLLQHCRVTPKITLPPQRLTNVWPNHTCGNLYFQRTSLRVNVHMTRAQPLSLIPPSRGGQRSARRATTLFITCFPEKHEVRMFSIEVSGIINLLVVRNHRPWTSQT